MARPTAAAASPAAALAARFTSAPSPAPYSIRRTLSKLNVEKVV
jgi:hypothetical protein